MDQEIREHERNGDDAVLERLRAGQVSVGRGYKILFENKEGETLSVLSNHSGWNPIKSGPNGIATIVTGTLFVAQPEGLLSTLEYLNVQELLNIRLVEVEQIIVELKTYKLIDVIKMKEEQEKSRRIAELEAELAKLKQA